MIKFSQMRLKELMAFARHSEDLEAAAWLEVKAYLLVIDLAISQEWQLDKQLAGVQVLRQAARIALARVLPAAFWAECHYCIDDCKCSVCGGTGSLVMSEVALAKIVGAEWWPEWQQRIDCIAQMLRLIKTGEGVR
jgi:hypothetical protein